MKLESYFESQEEKDFTTKVLNEDLICLTNDVHDMYSQVNECWFDDVTNLYDNESDEYKDVFQWFFVSDWLANKLNLIQEPILDTGTRKMWGRTTFGQSIELDGIIQQIYRTINNQTGE